MRKHERIVCIIAGLGIGSTITIPLNATGEITTIDGKKREARVQFDPPFGVELRVPLSHLRTEGHIEGHHE